MFYYFSDVFFVMPTVRKSILIQCSQLLIFVLIVIDPEIYTERVAKRMVELIEKEQITGKAMPMRDYTNNHVK